MSPRRSGGSAFNDRAAASKEKNSDDASRASTSRHALAEEALRQSEARLGAVLETAVDAIITIDQHGIVQTVNPATERIFGYSAAEIVGRNVSMLMPPPYQQEHDGYLERYLRTGERHIIGVGREVEGRKKDGTIFAVDLAVSEVERGRLFTGIVRDISDRKLVESRIRESDRLASIGTLAAGLGHDMNNVLLPVRAHLNALKADSGGVADRRDHVDKIQKGVTYLQQLADGLHFLAMDPERVENADGITDIRRWWSQTGPLLSKAAPKHAKVTTSFAKNVPPIAMAAHALTQAVLNLIVNAGEAIPDDSKRPHGIIRITAELDEDNLFVRLSVKDNGCGMTEQVKRRAFDMFFTTKPRGFGTGLGLALVRRVVDHAGGTVAIDSKLGHGTTVTLRLPVASHSACSDDAPFVALSIRDNRANSLARNLLDAAGAEIVSEFDDPRTIIWIAEPSQISIDDATRWSQSHPKGIIVLFGKPRREHISAWKEFKPVTIHDPDDFDAVRAGIKLALSAV